MSGFKTYGIVTVMVVLGIYFLTTHPSVSWDTPTSDLADLRAVVRQAIGALMVTMGLGFGTIRHAIGKLSR